MVSVTLEGDIEGNVRVLCVVLVCGAARGSTCTNNNPPRNQPLVGRSRQGSDGFDPLFVVTALIQQRRAISIHKRVASRTTFMAEVTIVTTRAT